jgi:type VI secretion system protein ImpH
MTPTPPADALLAALARQPTAFDFFQAVELLERAFPDREPVGHFGDPEREVVHFRAPASLAFPSAEVTALHVPEDGGAPARMDVTFLGLTGPSGVLPRYYTEQVIVRNGAKDPTLRDFLDLFHHRWTSLFFRAWRKTRPHAGGGAAAAGAAEDGALGGGSAWLTSHLRSLVGIGTDELRARLPASDQVPLYYAALLLPRPRSALALERLLADYFDVPVAVEQFAGGWYPLAAGTQCALGEDGPSSLLGDGAVVGDEVHDPQGRVRLRVGPLTRARYDAFLPTGDAHEPLRALVRLFAGDDLDFELRLVLARDEVPACVLDADRPSPPLGWCTWLRAGPLTRDPDDAALPL